jgi:hypothetical protein
MIARLAAPVAPPYDCMCCKIPPLARSSRRTVIEQLLADAAVPKTAGDLDMSGLDINAKVQSLQEHIDNLGDVANAQQYKDVVAARFRMVPFLRRLSLLPSGDRRRDFRALQEVNTRMLVHLDKVGISFRS